MGLIRFYLAISVIIAHNAIRVPGVEGHLAVLAFFVISGFYMGLVLNEKYVGNTSGFYLARFLRLWPSYIVVFIIVLLFLAPMGAQAYATPFTAIYVWLTSITMFFYETLWWFGIEPTLGNLVFLDQQAQSAGIRPLTNATHMQHMWSIGVEISFYIVAPLIARKPRIILITLAMAFALHLTIKFNLFPRHPFQNRSAFNTFWLFLLGMIAYWGWTKCRKSLDALNLSPLWLSLSGVALTILCIAAVQKYYSNPYMTACYYILFAASLIPIFHATKKAKWDRAIGELSYPIYLIHWPISSLIINGHRGSWLWAFIIIGWSLFFSIALHFLIDKHVEKFRARLSVRPSLRVKNDTTTDLLI